MSDPLADSTAPASGILVVEDEDNIALALDWLLTREGYRHERVRSGAEALPAIRRAHPALVLLVGMLPGMSGYEICKDVRDDPALRDTRILRMTAGGSALSVHATIHDSPSDQSAKRGRTARHADVTSGLDRFAIALAATRESTAGRPAPSVKQARRHWLAEKQKQAQQAARSAARSGRGAE